jgi:hypothetical protein
MQKKTSLASALRQSSDSQKEGAVTDKATTQPTEKTRTVSPTPSNRLGKKSITGWFEADVLKQLKMIGLDKDMSIQQMVGEALNDFFAKNGKPQIAR